jgi:hypothetical protein
MIGLDSQDRIGRRARRAVRGAALYMKTYLTGYGEQNKRSGPAIRLHSR